MKSILCPFFYLIACAYSHSSMDLASNFKVHTESHASSFSLLSRQPPKEANRLGDLSRRKCSCSVDVPHNNDTATRCSLPERQSKSRLFSSLSTIHGRSAPTLARGHLLDVFADPSGNALPHLPSSGKQSPPDLDHPALHDLTNIRVPWIRQDRRLCQLIHRMIHLVHQPTWEI